MPLRAIFFSGHYDGPHNHSSPPDLQANYGGTFLDLGIGLNALVPLGNLTGNRLGVEWTLPVYHEVNGFQQRRSGSLFVVWSQSL